MEKSTRAQSNKSATTNKAREMITKNAEQIKLERR